MEVRRLVVGPSLLAASLLAVTGGITPSATAAPPAAPTDDFIDPANRCFFDLTAPSLVELPGGAKSVTASLVTKRCTGKAAPTNVVVCIAAPQTSGQCGNEFNWEAAQVFVTTPQLDVPFTATAVGCWRNLLAESQEKCEPSDPVTTTF